jgi:hypothetical protein
LLFFGVWRRLAERKKTPILRAFCDLGAHYLTLSQWLAGDTVQIAPVSSPNSLQTGNFTGKIAVLRPGQPVSNEETPVPQRPFEQFPTRINREDISKNREF